jgi:hypothetical protein
MSALVRPHVLCVRCLATLVFALAWSALPGAAEEAGWRHRDVERVVAFGDVHGDHAALRTLLHAAGIVDDDDRWQGGRTHLVSLGDLLDRGPDSRRVMDLLMRLQGEAAEAGGHVHVLVGNHELMNLTGDLRYVAAEEYAAFAGPEDDRLRAEALERAQALGLPPEAVQGRPPGFFAHRAAFRPDGHYGAWLLAQRTMVEIDGRIFLHGGVSPALLEVPGEDPEARISARMRALVAEVLDDAYQRPDMLGVDLLALGGSTAEERVGMPPARVALAERLASFVSDPAFGPDGPFWYRGNANCHPLLEAPVLEPTLAALGAEAVAVGHTPQRDGRIRSRLDGRVLLLDTGMLASYYRGQPRALVVEDGHLSVVSPDGAQDVPDPERPAVDAGLDATVLQTLLAEGGIEPLEDGRVRVRAGGRDVVARVLRLRERARQHARAARRLDELMGLGFVPAVVEREVDGRTVLLEVDDGRWLPEAERMARNIGVPGDCHTGHPFHLVRLFDALLGKARDADDLSYAMPSLAIRLTGNDDAFPRSDRVAALQAPPPTLAGILRSLDPDEVRARLGDLLDDRRLAALLARRATLLISLEES